MMFSTLHINCVYLLGVCVHIFGIIISKSGILFKFKV